MLRNVLLATLMLVPLIFEVDALCQTSPSSHRGFESGQKASSLSLHTGAYYALIIGIDNYRSLTPLSTPISDAKELARLLHDRYGFQTTLLLDANRTQILTALVDYRRTLPEDSNLLVYYAGHGHHDLDADEAYWLPVDALPDNNSNWISADDITRDVKAIRSLHILIISDSCYSGYLVASRTAKVGINPADRQAMLAKILKSKSRNLMSSGGDEPVADRGAPEHSIFAGALLKGFSQISDGTFTAADLFYNYVQPAVGGAVAQLPQYNWIRNSGHSYGDFVFSRNSVVKTNAKPQATSTTSGHAILQDCWIAAAQCGFKFSTAQVVPLPADNFVADIVLMNQTDQTKGEVQALAMLFAPNDTPPYNGGRDAGAKSGLAAVDATELSDVSSAPETGYSFHWFPVKKGGIYVVRTRDGDHFAKIKVTDLTNKSIGFDWVYQAVKQREF